MLLAGLQRVDGYAGLEPARRRDYAKAPAQRLAGATYVLDGPSRADCSDALWSPIGPSAPRARLVAHTIALEDRVDNAPPPFDTAAVETPLELPAAAPGTAQVEVDRPGHIAVRCEAPARQLLVTTESFHSGWRAIVDGRVARVVRVDGDFLGCVVDGGTRLVDLQFRPNSLLVGEYVSASGLGLLLCTFAVRLGANRPPRK
jgi:hypothetical protein